MRVIRFLGYGMLGLVLLVGAALVPIYLRAVDATVIKESGRHNKGLISEARSLLQLERVGPAQMLVRAANTLGLHEAQGLGAVIKRDRDADPELAVWGGRFPLLTRLGPVVARGKPSVVGLFVSEKVRAAALRLLEPSRRPGVREILKNRDLGRTAMFPPVASASGQALETAIVVMSMLSQGDHLSSKFREEVESLAALANRGHGSEGIESIYLDLLSLAKRMDWGQLSAFLGKIESKETLRLLVHAGVPDDQRLALVFAALWFAPSARDLAGYIQRYPESAMRDIRYSLTAGRGGIEHLLTRQERIHYPVFRDWLRRRLPLEDVSSALRELGLEFPLLALVVKYLCVLLGVFCLARSMFGFKGRREAWERPLRVEGADVLRQELIALLGLLVAVAIGEPFLAQDRQKVETPLNWTFPMAKQAVVAQVTEMIEPKVDEITVLSLVAFFVIQLGIYAFCLVKLSEIRRQRVASRLKLKLLDNEENMFDAGLYVGLGGTVGSLVFLALGVIRPSLMAAYSSTLFGIIFVSLLKIFHVRPYRRRLIVESELNQA